MGSHSFLLRICAVLAIIFIVMCGVIPIFAIELSDDSFVIIPEAGEESMGEDFSNMLGAPKGPDGYTFWEEYNIYTKELDNEKNAVGAQIKSGIISWNFILGLLQQIVRFVANAALIVGSLAIIYAGYLYVSAVYVGSGNTSKAQDAIRYAVIGIVIVIFSYAILKFFVKAFL